MKLHKLIPLLTLGGVAYAQKETIANVAESPLEIAKIVRTQMEITSIQRLLLTEVLTDGIPNEVLRNFPEYLKRNLLANTDRDVSLDPWGNPYQIQAYSDEYQIWSYGPDQMNDTEDDIWTAIPIRP